MSCPGVQSLFPSVPRKKSCRALLYLILFPNENWCHPAFLSFVKAGFESEEKTLVDSGSGPRLLNEVMHVKVIKQTSKENPSDITAKKKNQTHNTIDSHSLVTPFGKE